MTRERAARVAPSSAEPRRRGTDLAGAARLARSAAEHPGLVLVAASLFLIAVSFAVPNRVSPIADEGAYLYFARNLAHGSYAGVTFTQYLWHGPGLPAILAPFVALHAPLALVRLVSPVSLALALAATYVLLRPHVPRPVALAAAVGLLLYIPFYGVLHHIYSEPLTTLGVLAGFAAIGHYLRTGSRLGLALAAVALGWAAMVRVEFGWVITASLVMCAAGWLLFGRRRTMLRLTLVYLCALVFCVPWLAYTYSLTGRVFYWGNSGGLSLYWMASPNPRLDGDWHQPREVFRDRRLAPDRAVIAHADTLTAPRADPYLTSVAVTDIEHAPLHYLRNVAANVGRLILNLPYSFSSPSPFTILLAAINLTLLAALAAVLARGRALWRRVPAELLAGLAFTALAFAVHAALATYPRLGFPTVPLLVALGAWVAWGLHVARADRGRAIAAAPVAGARAAGT